MNIPERDSLVHAYETDVKEAYAELLDSFLKYIQTGEGKPQTMAGKCGAKVAAAHKRCKRGLVFSALSTAVEGGMDITPTVAENVFGRLIGRGVDFRAALSSFGTPGRTATNKSSVRAAHLAEFESSLLPEIDALILDMKVIRERYRDDYGEKIKGLMQSD